MKFGGDVAKISDPNSKNCLLYRGSKFGVLEKGDTIKPCIS